jgi:hypothetical protein
MDGTSGSFSSVTRAIELNAFSFIAHSLRDRCALASLAVLSIRSIWAI